MSVKLVKKNENKRHGGKYFANQVVSSEWSEVILKNFFLHKPGALCNQGPYFSPITLSVFGVGQFGRVVSEGRVKYAARAHSQSSNRRLKQYRLGDVMESWGVECGEGAKALTVRACRKWNEVLSRVW